MPSWLENIKSGIAESKGLAKELAETRRSYALGRQALKGDEPPAKSEPALYTPSPSDRVGRHYGDRPGEKLIDTSSMTKPLGSLAAGTTRVKQTGIYKLHKDEAVLNKKDAAKMRANRATASMGKGGKKKSKKSKRHVHEMTIRHSANGGYIARHSFKQPPGGEMQEPEEHTVPDVNALASHVQDNMATPPPAQPQQPMQQPGAMA